MWSRTPPSGTTLTEHIHALRRAVGKARIAVGNRNWEPSFVAYNIDTEDIITQGDRMTFLGGSPADMMNQINQVMRYEGLEPIATSAIPKDYVIIGRKSAVCHSVHIPWMFTDLIIDEGTGNKNILGEAVVGFGLSRTRYALPRWACGLIPSGSGELAGTRSDFRKNANRNGVEDVMADLSAFSTRLSRLSATKGIESETLTDFINAGLLAMAEYKPERVLMKKVPVTAAAEGLYDVPTDALTVARLFVHNTDKEIHFEVEQDSVTDIRKIRLGGVERPQWLFVGKHYAEMSDGVNANTFSNMGRLGNAGGFDFFDILYFRVPTFQRLTEADTYILQLYIEARGYEQRAGEVENLVDIRDTDPSGDATEIKKSGIGKQFMALAKGKQDAFERRLISLLWCEG